MLRFHHIVLFVLESRVACHGYLSSRRITEKGEITVKNGQWWAVDMASRSLTISWIKLSNYAIPLKSTEANRTANLPFNLVIRLHWHEAQDHFYIRKQSCLLLYFFFTVFRLLVYLKNAQWIEFRRQVGQSNYSSVKARGSCLLSLYLNDAGLFFHRKNWSFSYRDDSNKGCWLNFWMI